MALWFFSVNRVSDNDFIRYGLQELSHKGIKINVIDVSNLMWKSSHKVLDNKIPFDITYCTYLSEFNSVILLVSSADVVLCGGQLPPQLHSRIFRRCNNVGFQALGAIPTPTVLARKTTDFLLKHLRNGKLVNKVFSKLYSFYIYKKHPYSFVMRAGVKSTANYLGVNENTNILECQSYDIYSYLYQNTQVKKTDEDQKYLLWIDQAIPFHTDGLKSGKDLSFLSEEYFNRIKALLMYCERKYKLKVIVTLHPRMANDQRYMEVWKGWNTVVGETNHYIRYSNICMTHDSTSIHAVAYFNRPLIIVKDKILTDNGFDNGTTDTLAKELMCKIIHSENFKVYLKQDTIPVSNKMSYKKYVSNYVSNANSNKAENGKKAYDFLTNLQE
jgi:hypothetical protein